MLPAMRPRPWGRFIDVVPEIKVASDGVDRVARGAKWMAPADLTPIVVDFSCGVDDDKDTGNLGLTETTTAAFLSFNLLTCSTLSGDLEPLAAYTEYAFAATISEALTIAATTQLSASHLNLATNSTALAANTNLTEVIATIELGLAQRISNEQGYIFISPRYLAAAVTSGVVSIINGVLYSPGGHIVISDAGHRPYNVLYGTGALGYAISDTIQPSGRTGELDRTRNLVSWLSENYGLIAFNPAWSVKATLTGGVSS
jgi:hypothetical protein